MPPITSHKKSRTGCLRCKSRKVKCDEVRPQCTNCARHDVPCEYKLRPDERADGQRAVALRPREPGTPSDLEKIMDEAAVLHGRAAEMRVSGDDLEFEDLLTPAQHRQLELYLLHHYESCAIWTIGSSITPEGREMWSITAVDLSFEHPFLQTAILAFSALHIVLRTPALVRCFSAQVERDAALRALQREIKWTWSLPPDVVHRMFVVRALRQQQKAIQSVTAESANAVFLAMLLLTVQAMPRPSFEPQQVLYEPPIHWLRMITANQSVCGLCIHLQPVNNIAYALLPDDGPHPRDTSSLLAFENCEPFKGLLDWASTFEQEPFSEAMRETYTLTLAYVGSIWKGLVQGESEKQIYHRLMCLGTFIPCGFVDLVEEGRPRALAILAVYSSITQLVDDHWLWHGFATTQVHGIASILPAEWQWAMDKPKEIMQQLLSNAVSASAT